jgi:glucose-6-phosphate isomerase, archaeal
MEISTVKNVLNINSGLLQGEDIIESCKYLKDLKGIFQNEDKLLAMDGNTLVYKVQAYMPVSEGKSGGLFFGNSTIFPGKVGDEYFMTRGHFHANTDTGEYYWCISGEGALLLMDEHRNTRAEKMQPGSLHYIPGKTAHRVINTGQVPLIFNACWPSDAGHDYDEIAHNGFSARLIEKDGKPELIIV